jgi:hypothetical protein
LAPGVLKSGPVTLQDPASSAAQTPPFGIQLPDYARISADLAEGDRPAALALAAYDLTPESFAELSIYWTGRMAHDLQHGDGSAAITMAFSAAFTQAQDEKKALIPLSVEEWAMLTLQLERDGVQVLALRGLRSADHMRLVRHWARTLGADPALAARYAAVRDGDSPSP